MVCAECGEEIFNEKLDTATLMSAYKNSHGIVARRFIMIELSLVADNNSKLSAKYLLDNIDADYKPETFECVSELVKQAKQKNPGLLVYVPELIPYEDDSLFDTSKSKEDLRLTAPNLESRWANKFCYAINRLLVAVHSDMTAYVTATD